MHPRIKRDLQNRYCYVPIFLSYVFINTRRLIDGTCAKQFLTNKPQIHSTENNVQNNLNPVSLYQNMIILNVVWHKQNDRKLGVSHDFSMQTLSLLYTPILWITLKKSLSLLNGFSKEY